MPFSPVTWVNGTSPPISAANLQRYETVLAALVKNHRNVVDYGAVCDDVTNDTTAVSAALAAVAAAGGGAVVVPGKCAVDPDVLDLPSNCYLVGTGKRSWLRLRGAGILLDHSGTATGFGNHVNNSGIANLSLNGGGFTGTLLRAYYADNLTSYGLRFENLDGRAVDALELWDSDWSQCIFEVASSATAPSVHIRNSIAASGFGFSSDNSNMLKFAQCRFEGFRAGALWVERGGFGTNNPNGIFIDSCKFETHNVRGRPIYFDDTCMHVNIHKSEGFMGAFDAGYSTAQPFITCNAPGLASLRDIRGVAEEAASMASVIQSFNGAGPHEIANIEHRGSFNPTVGVVDFQGGAGRYDIGNVYSASGATLFAGTHPYSRSTTYAASVTPALAAKRTTHRITLTGNITINVPTGNGRQIGDHIRFELTQDGTGGRTTTFGSGYRSAWTPTTTANRLNIIEFEFNGTDWTQVAATVGIV